MVDTVPAENVSMYQGWFRKFVLLKGVCNFYQFLRGKFPNGFKKMVVVYPAGILRSSVLVTRYLTAGIWSENLAGCGKTSEAA
jgi:hypothetical protein